MISSQYKYNVYQALFQRPYIVLALQYDVGSTLKRRRVPAGLRNILPANLKAVSFN